MFALLNRVTVLLLPPALVGCILVAAQAQTQQLPPQEGAPDAFARLFRPAFTAEQVEAWKKKYPFQSIRERLNYEVPKSSAEAARLRAESEAFQVITDLRSQSLEMLHTLEVQDFIARSGNGFSRRPTPAGGHWLDLPPAKPPQFAKLPPLSAEEARFPATRLLSDETVSLDRPFVEASWLPSRRDAIHLHSYSVVKFVDPRTFGLVKSLDRVAGFESHRFRVLPEMPIDTAPPVAPVDGERRWKLTRLELVSLLKHETPRVYESEQLPTMEELSSKDAKTRALDRFEADALQPLRDGHHVQSSSTPNRVVMLGAIRASDKCRQCHEVPDGALLGAFSYELRRDPPLKIEQPLSAVR